MFQLGLKEEQEWLDRWGKHLVKEQPKQRGPVKKALSREKHGLFEELKECPISFLQLRQFPSLLSSGNVGQGTSFP